MASVDGACAGYSHRRTGRTTAIRTNLTITPAILVLLLCACNPQPQHTSNVAQATATPTPAGLPPLKITGHAVKGHPVTIVQQTGNRKQYTLTAQSLVSRSAQNIAQGTFHQATVTFYDKDGTELAAQAPTAAVDEGRDRVVLSGGVHARTSTGVTLTCDTLTYTRSNDMLAGSGNVHMTATQNGNRETLSGNSFTSDVKLSRMVMH